MGGRMTSDRLTYTIQNPEDLQQLFIQPLNFPCDLVIFCSFDDLETTLYAILPLCSRGTVQATRRELDDRYIWYQLTDQLGTLGSIGGISVVQTTTDRTTITLHPPHMRIQGVVPEDWMSDDDTASTSSTVWEQSQHPHLLDDTVFNRVRHAIAHATERLRETNSESTQLQEEYHQKYAAALSQAEEIHHRQFQMFEQVMHELLSKLANEPLLSPGYQPVGQRAKAFYLAARQLVYERGYSSDDAFRQIFPTMFAEVASELMDNEAIDPTSILGFERIVLVARSRFNLGVGC